MQSPMVNQFGDKFWFDEHHGYHREDGPAIEWVAGHIMWYRHDKLHRTDGPAVIDRDGKEYWYLDGRELDPLEIFLILGKQKG